LSDNAPPTKLPALAIIGQALRFPFTDAAPLLRFASVPFLATLAAMVLLHELAPFDSPSPRRCAASSSFHRS